jgi:hypothetical protein
MEIINSPGRRRQSPEPARFRYMEQVPLPETACNDTGYDVCESPEKNDMLNRHTTIFSIIYIYALLI